MNTKSKLLPYIGASVLLSFLANCTPVPTQALLPLEPIATVSTDLPTTDELPPPTPFEPIDTQIRAPDGMRMVHVPAGTFIIGSTDEQAEQVIQDCLDTYGVDEECHQEICRGLEPAHPVSLDSFWLDQTEVTNATYTVFLNDQGNQIDNGVSWFEPGAGHHGVVYGHIREHDGIFSTLTGYEDHPVIEVSWYGAAAYCAWVGGRLPTEAEWEYAARGPNANIFPWGDTFDGERTNYCDGLCSYEWRDTSIIDGASRWTAVGSYPLGASWVGALDMAGNVHEWVSDYWSEIDNLRVSRGGSWFDPSYRMSTVCRKGLTPSSARMHWVGFRCVIPAEI